MGSSSLAEKGYDHTRLWHLRLAHISEKGLTELHKHGLLGKEQITNIDFYEDSVRGKSTRVKFSQGSHVTKEILNYVHFDYGGRPKLLQMVVQGISCQL